MKYQHTLAVWYKHILFTISSILNSLDQVRIQVSPCCKIGSESSWVGRQTNYTPEEGCCYSFTMTFIPMNRDRDEACCILLYSEYSRSYSLLNITFTASCFASLYLHPSLLFKRTPFSLSFFLSILFSIIDANFLCLSFSFNSFSIIDAHFLLGDDRSCFVEKSCPFMPSTSVGDVLLSLMTTLLPQNRNLRLRSLSIEMSLYPIRKVMPLFYDTFEVAHLI